MPGNSKVAPFDIAIRPLGGPATEVLVLNASGPSRPSASFISPASLPNLAALLAKLENHADRDLQATGAVPAAFQALESQAAGGALFTALFHGEVARLLDLELSRLASSFTGITCAPRLRIRLFFDPGLVDIAALPWELLYHPGRREFLGRSPTMALSRCLPAERLVPPPPVRLPLKVVVVGPAPLGMDQLELTRELESLRRGLAAYPAVEVVEVQPATLEHLLEVLERDPEIHLVHFMGHGCFASATGEGALVFVGPHGEAHLVSGEVLSAHLPASVRLAVLNSCNSGRLPRQRGQDPFAAVATALLLAGLPAVVAMQFAIADQAALSFSAKFYSRMAQGDSVDIAANHGRQAVFDRAPRSLEWIKPVVFMQVADGQVLLAEEPPRREVAISLVLLGGAAAEADALESVVRELEPKLRPLAISIRSRRASPDTTMATADSANIHVCLLSDQSALSDATQEQVAVKLLSDIAAAGRRSGILFYGSALEAGLASWSAAITELRWRKPELFCSFTDVAGLSVRFRQLLLQHLFEEANEPSNRPPVPSPLPWAATLARLVDAAAGAPSYLDRSARRVQDRIARLGQLSAFPGALTATEAEILQAAAHLRALAGADLEAGGENSLPAEIAVNLREELGWEPRFATAAGCAAAAAAQVGDLSSPWLRTGPWRLDLIAALLRLSELLDLDRRAVRANFAGGMPEVGEDLAAWLAYLTREVRISRGGIVQFALTVPTVEWIEPLKRSTSLRVEAAWQELRMILLGAGVTVAVAPSEVLLSAGGPAPAEVLDRLRRFGAEVSATGPDLSHLAEADDALPPLELLLPLPCATVDADEKLAYSMEAPAFLELVDELTGEVVTQRPIAAGEREVVLGLEDLRPDRWVRWFLYSEIIAGEKELERLGRLRPLSPARQRLLEATETGSVASGAEPWRLLLALGLHSRLLRLIAARLVSGEATPSETVLAHELCVNAYLWTLRAAPTCPLVETYRQATLWIASRLPLQGGLIS